MKDSARRSPRSRFAIQLLALAAVGGLIPDMASPLRITNIAHAVEPPAAASDDSEQAATDSGPHARPRARDLGIQIGIFSPGSHNAITDVDGVLVGHRTVNHVNDARTGATAILPHSGNLFQDKVPAAIVVGNGFGKLIGKTQVDELGQIETPIVLTNTLCVFNAANAVVSHCLSQTGNESVRSVNPVVGETNDGYLNNIRVRFVAQDDVRKALLAAHGGPVREGSVGAGTGTRCFGFKGGIGTSSRQLPEGAGGCTIGVLVQSNFHGILTIAGAPVAKELGNYLFKEVAASAEQEKGSCMIVVATDAPMDARQLQRLARRALLGLGAIGSPMTHGSGDYVIAFSTARSTTHPTLDDSRLSPMFQAVKESTEEAILNSLLRAETVTGYRGRTVQAIPIERLIEICRRYGVIKPD